MRVIDCRRLVGVVGQTLAVMLVKQSIRVFIVGLRYVSPSAAAAAAAGSLSASQYVLLGMYSCLP